VKKEIIQQCLQEFLKHGIRKMKIKDLVEPIGISTKTLYKFFTDKEDLLEQCVSLHYMNLHKGLDEIFKRYPSPVVALFQIWINAVEADFGVTHLFYHDLNYYYPALQDKIFKRNEKKFTQPLIQIIEAGIKQGYFRGNLSAPLVLEGIGVVYSSLSRSTQFKKFKRTPFQLAENTVEVYLRGLCTAKGLAELEKNAALTSFTQHT